MKKNSDIQNQHIQQPQFPIKKEQISVLEQQQLQKQTPVKKESFADHQETDTHSQAKYYYNMVFSSYYDGKHAKLFNHRDQQNDDYCENEDYIKKSKQQKRKQKVKKLSTKESQQMKSLEQVLNEDQEKYNAIIAILKFFTTIKQKVKVDYYSHKTFMAIKSSSCEQLTRMLHVLKRIYQQTIRSSELQQDNITNKQKQYQIIRQFLIIPRFLISREKIQDFVNYEQVQDSFQFLVQKLCLGHENNEANKKMPDTQLMALLRDLLEKENGKEIFKTICTINHGNKFRLDRGNTAYIQLFFKDLDELRKIDKETKKHYKRSQYLNSTVKSKSHYSSDEEFDPIPQRKKTKSKLKSGQSLQIEQNLLFVEEPQHGGKLGMKKHTQSMNLNIKMQDQYPSIEQAQLLPPIRLQVKADQAQVIPTQIQIKKQQPSMQLPKELNWSYANKLKTNIVLVSPNKVKDQNTQIKQ